MKTWVINFQDSPQPEVIREVPLTSYRHRDPDEGDCYVHTREHYVEVFYPSWVTGNGWKTWIYPWGRIRSIEIIDDRRSN